MAWERYSGDTYENALGPDRVRWVRTSDEPDETRVRAMVEWLRRPAPTGLHTRLRLGWEGVTRFDFTDADRSNLMGQVAVEYRW